MPDVSGGRDTHLVSKSQLESRAFAMDQAHRAISGDDPRQPALEFRTLDAAWNNALDRQRAGDVHRHHQLVSKVLVHALSALRAAKRGAVEQWPPSATTLAPSASAEKRPGRDRRRHR